MDRLQKLKRVGARNAANLLEQCIPALMTRVEESAKRKREAMEAAAAAAEGASSESPTSKRARGGGKAASSSSVDAVLPPTKASLAANPNSYIGVRMAKDFGGAIYEGSVEFYDEAEVLWKIVYDDGDEEDYDADGMLHYYSLYVTNSKSTAALAG